jgi:ADP-ribose pyrophosphatase YjhB (NUDIX family)
MKINESWYIKPKNQNFPSSVAAGGVVVREEKGKLLIALIGTDYYKDYSLPKGKQEDGEKIEITARREIAEETGLSNLELICELGIKERLSFEKSDWKTIHYYLFKTDEISGKQNLQKGEEDLTLDWFDLDNLPLLFWPEQRELIKENKKTIKNLLS